MRYRVEMVSRPGMYAQYDGYVEVLCESDDPQDIFYAAVRELRRTAFSDRGADCWCMNSYEQINLAADDVE